VRGSHEGRDMGQDMERRKRGWGDRDIWSENALLSVQGLFYSIPTSGENEATRRGNSRGSGA